jgi:L-ascorbate metabolism protein UlaG (beta-lactamase superfamily)
MHVEWYGQSAFRLADASTTVFIDPFADMTPLLDRGTRCDYPAIAGVEADLLRGSSFPAMGHHAYR